MIVDFSFSNFRSIKDEQYFSMEAEAIKSKSDNTFKLTLADESESREATKLRLLKSAVVYGANASGKTNFIRALNTLKYFVLNSGRSTVDRTIIYYQPFVLEKDYDLKPTRFQLTFVAQDLIKYRYEIEYNKHEIQVEKLISYPKGQPAELFRRISEDRKFHSVKYGESLKDKPNRKEFFKNQLILSKFGYDEPNEQLTPIYKYFDEMEIWNALNRTKIERLSKEIAEEIFNSKNQSLANKISKLLRIADTKIESVSVRENQQTEFRFSDDFPDEVKEDLLKRNRFRTFARHPIFENGEEVGTIDFDLIKDESAGTNVLFALGGIILKKLETGGIIIFDELDNSLHPKLCKFLIRLFNNPVSNPRHAQLIFATHEVTLLDKDIFRKDQIWFTEKNKFGQTQLFSANDVEGLRDDTNFELWYRTGKFGGNPKIKEVEFIFGNE